MNRWIQFRFLCSLYTLPFLFCGGGGGGYEIATGIISRFAAYENEIPYHIFGLFDIHIFVDNLSDKRLISLELLLVPSVLALSQIFPNSLFLLGSFDGVDKT